MPADMRTILKLLSALTLLLICITDEGGAVATCGPSTIIVTQARTPRIIEGQPEFEVAMSNSCKCPQSNVVVGCYGLGNEPVDPRAIRLVDKGRCLVNDGRPIVRGSPVRFRYSMKNPVDFPVISTQTHCSSE